MDLKSTKNWQGVRDPLDIAKDMGRKAQRVRLVMEACKDVEHPEKLPELLFWFHEFSNGDSDCYEDVVQAFQAIGYKEQR